MPWSSCPRVGRAPKVTFSLPSRCTQVDEGRRRRSADRCRSNEVSPVRCGCCTLLLHLMGRLTLQRQLLEESTAGVSGLAELGVDVSRMTVIVGW